MLARLDLLKGDLDGDTEGFDIEGDALVDAAKRHRLRRELRQALKAYVDTPPSDGDLENHAGFAREEFGLDDVDTEILVLLLRYERNSNLEQFADEVLHRLRAPARALAALLRIDAREAHSRMVGGSRLLASGLACLSEDGLFNGLAGHTGFLRLARSLRKIMHRSYSSREEWAAALVGQPVTTPLGWGDFEHLGAARDLAAKVMAGARNAGARGVNILLHGPVGTGKTEFAKVLAAHIGMRLWSVGETDEQGGEPTRDERLAALKLAQRLLAKQERTLVLLDEAEDILSSDITLFGPFTGRSRDGSKVYVNRLLEQNAIPIVWTCNDTAGINPAILRRMTQAVEIGTPDRPMRARIWRRALAEAELSVGEDVVERLASSYQTPPAVACSAARAAALSGGGAAAIEEAMTGILRLLGSGACVAETGADSFDPALVNCRDDLATLVDHLVRPGAPQQWSLCIHGAPGTGKSQFARHLARRLGMEVAQQRASDLLSCWVGDSEKQIAAAFAAARARRAMLVIDEADSLLSDRREAVRSWEVTQVNEVLTWMESHPLPFVCTTNLMDRLDPASLRRFTFKLKFETLTSAQAALAFERFFGMPAPRRLPEGLAPGDFATVRRKFDLLGAADPLVLADWLDREVEAKGARTQPIGFAAT